MRRPLLPALEAAGQLREVSFALLRSQHRPIAVAELAEAAGLGVGPAQHAVDTLAGAGWLDVDARGSVVGAAGLSLTTGPHALALGDAAFRTWCAYDALGIAAALGADAMMTTTCGQCERLIEVAFRAGVPDRIGPERLWLAEGDADLRGSFCSPTVLLCGDSHGALWSRSHADRGELVDLGEGARRGTADWAGCAAAAARLS